MERSPFLHSSRQKARHIWLFQRFRDQRSRRLARRRGSQPAPHENFRSCTNARCTSQKPPLAGKSAERQDACLKVAASKGPAARKAAKKEGFSRAAAQVGKSRVVLTAN